MKDEKRKHRESNLGRVVDMRTPFQAGGTSSKGGHQQVVHLNQARHLEAVGMHRRVDRHPDAVGRSH